MTYQWLGTRGAENKNKKTKEKKKTHFTSWSLWHVIHVDYNKTIVLQLCKKVILDNHSTWNLELYFLLSQILVG